MSANAVKKPSKNRWGDNKRSTQQDGARRAILEAAVSCFEKKGMNSTTIDEIATAANITRRTVYHYFKSKKHILEAAVEQHASDCIFRMIESVEKEQPFGQYLAACLVYIIENIPKEPFYKLQTSDSVGISGSYFYFTSPKVKDVWIDAFQQPYIEALRERTINPDLRLDDIIMWAGRIALSYLQYPAPSSKNKNLADELESFFINALRFGL